MLALTEPRHDTGTRPNVTEREGWRGYVATCSCGWLGRHRADPKRAREDAASHRQATDRRP